MSIPPWPLKNTHIESGATIGGHANAIVDWTFHSESESDGEGMDDAGNLLTLRPGANIAINDMLSVETRVPFTVMGKNDPIFWGINVLGIYSFGL